MKEVEFLMKAIKQSTMASTSSTTSWAGSSPSCRWQSLPSSCAGHPAPYFQPAADLDSGPDRDAVRLPHLSARTAFRKRPSWRWTWSTPCSLSGPAHPGIVTCAIFLVPSDGLVPASWTFFLNAYTTGEQTYSVGRAHLAVSLPVRGLVLLAIQAVLRSSACMEGTRHGRASANGKRRRDDCDFGTTAGGWSRPLRSPPARWRGADPRPVRPRWSWALSWTGPELAFVLGAGAGVIVGWHNGVPRRHHRRDKIYDQMQATPWWPSRNVRADGQLPDPLQGGGRPV